MMTEDMTEDKGSEVRRTTPLLCAASQMIRSDDCLHSIAEDLAKHAGTGDVDWVDSEKEENPTSTEYNMMHANNISSNHNNTHTQRIVVVA